MLAKHLFMNFGMTIINPQYGDRAKLCYTDTDSFIIHIITQDFYKDITNDVKRWFDTSYYDQNDEIPLPIGMNKKVLDLFKDALGTRIVKEFCTLTGKT